MPYLHCERTNQTEELFHHQNEPRGRANKPLNKNNKKVGRPTLDNM